MGYKNLILQIDGPSNLVLSENEQCGGPTKCSMNAPNSSPWNMLQALNMVYIEKCQWTDERHAHMHDCACSLNMSCPRMSKCNRMKSSWAHNVRCI